MRRTASGAILTIRRGGHFWRIRFDEQRREALLDYLLDLAQDVESAVTWQDVFDIIDALAAREAMAMRLDGSSRNAAAGWAG